MNTRTDWGDGWSESSSDMQRRVPFGRFTAARPARDDLPLADMPQPGGRMVQPVEGPRRETLPELIQEALRCALCPAASDAGLRDAMRRTCAAARAEGMQPERLLVAVKQTWQELPEARRMLRDTREATLDSVVTLCITEYFAPWQGTRG